MINIQDTAAGAVDAGNLFCFNDDIPEQELNDLLDSNLLAQLMADKKFSRFEHIHQWYDFYTQSLGKLAWRTQGLKFSEIKHPGNSFTVKGIVLDEMRKMQSAANMQRVEDSIETLNLQSADAPAAVVFRAGNHISSAAGSIVNLQISFAQPTSELSMVCLVFSTSNAVENPLTMKFHATNLKNPIQVGRLSSMLNTDVYNGVRQTVIDKLGSKRDEYIVPFTAPVQDERPLRRD